MVLIGLSITKTLREKGRGLCLAWNDSFLSLSQFVKIFTSLGWRERVKCFPNSDPSRDIPWSTLGSTGIQLLHWDLPYSWMFPLSLHLISLSLQLKAFWFFQDHILISEWLLDFVSTMSEILTGDKLKPHPKNLIPASSPLSQQPAGGDGAFLAEKHQCNKESILSSLYNQSAGNSALESWFFRGVQVSQVPQGSSNVTGCPHPVWAAESHTRGKDFHIPGGCLSHRNPTRQSMKWLSRPQGGLWFMGRWITAWEYLPDIHRQCKRLKTWADKKDINT